MGKNVKKFPFLDEFWWEIFLFWKGFDGNISFFGKDFDGQNVKKFLFLEKFLRSRFSFWDKFWWEIFPFLEKFPWSRFPFWEIFQWLKCQKISFVGKFPMVRNFLFWKFLMCENSKIFQKKEILMVTNVTKCPKKEILWWVKYENV